jgi:Asp-tRNA(Asn)/Glu-tRNA(Gln) amidotransferase A subunit family amidase
MTKTVEDAALLLRIIADERIRVPKYTDALTGKVRDLRIGIPKTHFYENLDPDVANAMQVALGAFEKLGAKLMDVDLPAASVQLDTWIQIGGAEAFAYHEDNLKEHADMYGDDVRTRLETGRGLLSVNHVRAQQTRAMMQAECAKILQTCDVLITPTVPIPAPRIKGLEQPVIASLTRFTRYFNLTGQPAISVPCGFTPGGLPIGMQIAGRAFDEETVLRTAHAYEQNARWFERRPPIS